MPYKLDEWRHVREGDRKGLKKWNVRIYNQISPFEEGIKEIWE
jgi:hypothetical protein